MRWLKGRGAQADRDDNGTHTGLAARLRPDSGLSIQHKMNDEMMSFNSVRVPGRRGLVCHMHSGVDIVQRSVCEWPSLPPTCELVTNALRHNQACWRIVCPTIRCAYWQVRCVLRTGPLQSSSSAGRLLFAFRPSGYYKIVSRLILCTSCSQAHPGFQCVSFADTRSAGACHGMPQQNLGHYLPLR